MEKKHPIPTDITIFSLEPDTSLWRPHVRLKGVKSTNAVTISTADSNPERWKLFNHVLPQIPPLMGMNITANVCEGSKGKRTTAKMKDPGAVRKERKDSNETNPKVIVSMQKYRMQFIEDGNLQD